MNFPDFEMELTAPKGGSLILGAAAVTTMPPQVGSSLGFVHAFISSLSMIIVSELGDKTFFIAAIMAMRHPRFTVFTGAMTALALMTVLSALFGYATTIIPRIYTYYISTALFALFGFKMLYDGIKMPPNTGAEELDEVQASLRRRDDDLEAQPMNPESSPSSKSSNYFLPRRILFSLFSRVFLQALTMTFLAEWGDRSQLATVVLATTEDVVGVCVGGVLGHAMCTGLAVMGGRIIAQKISVRTVTIIGGVVFLLFAVTSLLLKPS